MTIQDVRTLPKSEIVNRLRILYEEMELVNQPPEATQTALDFTGDGGRAFPVWGYVFAFLFGAALLLAILIFCLVILPSAYKIYFKICGC